MELANNKQRAFHMNVIHVARILGGSAVYKGMLIKTLVSASRHGC